MSYLGNFLGSIQIHLETGSKTWIKNLDQKLGSKAWIKGFIQLPIHAGN